MTNQDQTSIGPIYQEPQPSRQQRRAIEREQAKQVEAVNNAIRRINRMNAIQHKRLERTQMQPGGFTRGQD